MAEITRARFEEVLDERDHYKQRVEQIRRNQARRVRNADARAEAAEQRLEAVREYAKDGLRRSQEEADRMPEHGGYKQSALYRVLVFRRVLSLLEQTGDSTPEEKK